MKCAYVSGISNQSHRDVANRNCIGMNDIQHREGDTMKKTLLIAFAAWLVLFLCGPSMATLYTIPVERALSFQDEGPTLNHDETLHLATVDHNFGPSVVDYVRYDYYATGRSGRFFDGVSLSFDLSEVDYLNNIHEVTLKFYLQTGSYADLTAAGSAWHHYQVLEGAFNGFNQDLGALGATGAVSFDYDAYAEGGWIKAQVDPSWVISDAFDITLRLWNAKLDAVELEVANSDPSSVPEPGTIMLLGLGLFGIAACRRSKTRK
jgi:hypothetical protein